MEHIEGIIAEFFTGLIGFLGSLVVLLKTIDKILENKHKRKGGKNEKPNG